MNRNRKALWPLLGSLIVVFAVGYGLTARSVSSKIDSSSETYPDRYVEGRSSQPASVAGGGPGDAFPTPEAVRSNEPEAHQLRSEGERREIFDAVKEKVRLQGGIPTFFDNFILVSARNGGESSKKPLDLYEQLQNSKNNRFCDYADRLNEVCALTGRKTSLLELDLALSQGTHTVVQWKEYDVFKTGYDFIIFWMIMHEVQPDVIVELGSGTGGSAIWLADIASALGLETKIYTYDIKKPDLSYPNIEFIEFDLTALSSTDPLPFKEQFVGKKMVIEDAHVNVAGVLRELDPTLSAGDYLIIEDSRDKRDAIAEFLESTDKTILADRYYLDFFGQNGSCCADSIFKVF